jgi:hypothetical protein
MFDFELDNSNYFDFSTKNRKDIVIRQNTNLPLIEIYPIPTENFFKLLDYIKNATVTFSMYDQNGQYIILDDSATINLNTTSNNLLKKEDDCKQYMDFTIQYKFDKKYTKKLGTFLGEFKITFINNKEEKTLITPIKYPLKILIIPAAS